MLIGALKKAISSRAAVAAGDSAASVLRVAETLTSPRMAAMSAANPLRSRAALPENSTLRFHGAKIWLQPLSPKKLAVQWHLPSEMRRDCREMFVGENTIFVLRIYRQTVGGETARRTLEFEIDINRRCCYLNLENGDGVFTGEIGLRCNRSRYIFIARSTAVEMLMPETPPAPVKNSSTPRPSEKTSPHIAAPVKTLLNVNNEIDWEWRDVVAEEQTSAVYRTFVNEGERGLRQRSPILPSPLPARKIALAARRLPAGAVGAAVKNLSAPTLPKPSAGASIPLDAMKAKILPHPEIRYPVQPLTAPLKIVPPVSRLAPVLPAKSAAGFAGKSAVNVKSQKLTELVGIREHSEIILRGRVKKIGQRVRVGGLLIEPDADGAFCVACVIRDGKLFVPVVEVEAARLNA